MLKGRVLKGTPTKAGYLTYKLSMRGVDKTHNGHALVCRAFIGPRPEGLHVRHDDGDPSNNALTNLLYGTPSENGKDRTRHGRNENANKTHCVNNHPLDADNVYPAEDGYRRCKRCARERAKRWYEEHRKAS